jgi:plastocyanin
MRLFTKLFLFAAIMLPGFVAQAATFTVLVGPNGNDIFSPDELDIHTGDQVTFVWRSGTHPTMSDSSPAAWAVFTPSPSTTRTITFNTPGSFPYHCTAHGFPGGGMSGLITVTLPTPTLDAKAETPALNLFPNPSKGGQVTLQVNQKAGQDYKLRLSNIIGREIRTVAIKPDLSTTGLPLNLGDLPVGMYFYSLLVNDKVVSTKRLIIQN